MSTVLPATARCLLAYTVGTSRAHQDGLSLCLDIHFRLLRNLLGKGSDTVSKTVEEEAPPGSGATSPEGTVGETTALALFLGDLC